MELAEATRIVEGLQSGYDWKDPVIKEAMRVVKGLYENLQTDRINEGEVFLDTSAGSLHGCDLLIGKAHDNSAIEGYHFKTARECIAHIFERNPDGDAPLEDEMIIAYTKTGIIDRWGAMKLKFHHVVGRADKIWEETK